VFGFILVITANPVPAVAFDAVTTPDIPIILAVEGDIEVKRVLAVPAEAAEAVTVPPTAVIVVVVNLLVVGVRDVKAPFTATEVSTVAELGVYPVTKLLVL
jgi:hypothetical protein